MGCFLGCFGSSKDRKRRKQRYKAIRRDQNSKSQNLVQTDAYLVESIKEKSNSLLELSGKNEKEEPLNLVKEKPINSLLELSGKNVKEEPLNLSARKKVTFDANVTTYEHVQVYDSTESLLERNENGETFPKSGETHFHSDSDDDKNVGSYPPNYRYRNCVESDDEVEDSDHEDENDGVLDEDDDDDEEDDDDYENELIPNPIPSSESVTETSLNPLLKPVQNLTQWKALKSKRNQLNPDSQKENSSLNSIPFPPKNLNQEPPADASLSNWLVSSEKDPPNDKRVGCYKPELEPVSSGKTHSQESTTSSLKSIEDRPILGALTLDELKQFSGSSCTPRKSPGRSPDDMPIIGSVGSYWSTDSARSLNSTSTYKGIPNTTSKYREDKKVNWHNTPFETRLERALNRDAA